MDARRNNTDAIRGVYERWGAGDFGASLDVLAPDAVLIMSPEFPDAGTYEGIEGIRSYTLGFLEPWERITIEAEDLTEVGDNVIAAVCQRGVGRGSGAETEFRYFHAWSFRDGRVVRLETCRDRAQALDALGAADG